MEISGLDLESGQSSVQLFIVFHAQQKQSSWKVIFMMLSTALVVMLKRQRLVQKKKAMNLGLKAVETGAEIADKVAEEADKVAGKAKKS